MGLLMSCNFAVTVQSLAGRMFIYPYLHNQAAADLEGRTHYIFSLNTLRPSSLTTTKVKMWITSGHILPNNALESHVHLGSVDKVLVLQAWKPEFDSQYQL